MKILCTICARGGSKEVKNKNIINFFGRPLIFQTINQAKKSNLFYKIVCSSDSKKILKISQKFGVDLTIKRPKKLSSDKIPKTKAIKHSLEVSEKFLYQNLIEIEKNINKDLADKNIEKAMQNLAILRQPIDKFFNEVKINSENPIIRRNRLCLLNQIKNVMHIVANFSQIEGEI